VEWGGVGQSCKGDGEELVKEKRNLALIQKQRQCRTGHHGGSLKVEHASSPGTNSLTGIDTRALGLNITLLEWGLRCC
jgi:hypothetical protein